MYGFSRVKNRRVIGVKNHWVIGVKKKLFFFVALAILTLPPSLQTFYTTSSILWERLIQKLRF